MQAHRIVQSVPVEPTRRPTCARKLQLVQSLAEPRCPASGWVSGIGALLVLVGPLFFLDYADRQLVLQATCGVSALLLLGQLPDSRGVWQWVCLPLAAAAAFFAALGSPGLLPVGLAVLSVSFGAMSRPVFGRPCPEQWFLKWTAALLLILALISGL